MKLSKALYLAILLALLIVCIGNANRHVPLDTVVTTTFRDTIYDRNLPTIELRVGTYHNFGDATTVGYKLILRGEELDINDALLYKENPKRDVVNPMRLLSPFHIHVGDSTDKRRIDHVYVLHKFPMSHVFSGDDSLVIITNKGNFVLYMDEDKRAAAKYMSTLVSLNNDLTETVSTLEKTRKRTLFIIAIITIACIIITYCIFRHYRKIQRIKSQEMDNLLMLLSENEMNSKHLKDQISILMRNSFSTINQLCYEYFEKADTNFLKKSIYVKVEQEIEKLKSREQLLHLEEVLNEYYDGIIMRLREQIPQLSEADMTLLTYLYSGLSARTICVLMDIQLKTFYMRRLRLKSKIESSDAPDKELFTSNM